MRIHSITAFQVPIRLKRPIRHASHERDRNETLLIRTELEDGSVGWGEGLPRDYVTGESIGSVWRHLLGTDFGQLADGRYSEPGDAVNILDRLVLANVDADPGTAVRECFGNSVRCAVELSLLDAVCRSVGCSIADAFPKVAEAASLLSSQSEVFYSGVITSAHGWLRQWRSAIRMKAFGFRQVKVKVGTPGIDDHRLLSRVRSVLGKSVNLRLDANEAWTAEHVLQRIAELLEFEPTSIEQPVRHEDVKVLSSIRTQVSVPLMLDESLCCMEDAQRAVENRTCDSFNLRISKCGGLLPCLRLAAFAVRHGLDIQLGCQVGETGILSAAGRHFACNVRQIRYLEGSYGRFLVTDQLTQEDLTFGYGGRASRLSGHGLGIHVDEHKVRMLAERTDILWPR